ncbi:MAG: hypothetical protein E7385_01950 [Ruminococcaceae bacterium]|nr:hypothetical protein [Oscillospiraceae bacterium]
MLEFLSSRGAMGLYLIALFILIIILAVNIMIALRIIREKADENKSTRKKKEKKSVMKGTRFTMLNKIDKEMSSYKPPEKNSIELNTFCDTFRNFAASKLGLFYDIKDIRRFVAGLGVTRLLIIRGMSGTGKTSLAYAFGQFLSNDSVIVPVQPMWKERSDLIGYFNEFTRRFNETTLLRKMYEALYSDEIYITVLDEVNISRIEYYFAEFLSLLEIPDENKRYLDVVSDSWIGDPEKLKDGKILLPSNMWFVGTANNDDSTFAISDKVYDRAMIIDLDKKATPFIPEDTCSIRISYDEFCSLINKATTQYTISVETFTKIRKLDEYLQEVFKISFGNRILRQIEAYIPVMIACGGTEMDAVDDIIARKILRKLDQQNPAFVKNHSEQLRRTIETLFGRDVLMQSINYITTGAKYGK